MKQSKFGLLFFIILVFCNVGCDQISKSKVRASVLTGEIIEIVDDHFILTNTENTGAFFGLGSDMSPTLKIIFLQAIPVLTMLFLFYFVFVNQNSGWLFLLGMGFTIGGGIGNIYDRILLGSVTDFLHIDFGLFRTGIFNMADVSVMIGGFLLLIYIARHKRLVSNTTQEQNNNLNL